jgi:hypothetical protein
MIKGLCIPAKIEELKHCFHTVAEASLLPAQIPTVYRCIKTLYQGMLWADDIVLSKNSLRLVEDEDSLGIFHKGPGCLHPTIPSATNQLLEALTSQNLHYGHESDRHHSWERVETVILWMKKDLKLYSSFRDFHLRRWCVVPALMHILSYYAGYDHVSFQCHPDRLTAVDVLNCFIKQNYPNPLEIFYAPDSPLNLELDSEVPGSWVEGLTKFLQKECDPISFK